MAELRVASSLVELVAIKNSLHAGKWAVTIISGFGVTVGLHSLEVVFGSMGLSQDWRMISVPVGSCGLFPG